MITILSMLEAGYESTYEHLTFKQVAGAYIVKLITIPHNYPTFQEGLDAAVGTKVFMVPPGRVAHSTDFSLWTPPPGDLVFCFGSPQESMKPYITPGDIALHINTPFAADMMAVCVAGIVLYVHG